MSAVLYDAPGPRARRRSLVASVIGGIAILALLYLAYRQLDSHDQFEAARWQVFTDPPLGQSAGVVWRSLLVTGLGATLQAAGVAAVIAVTGGLLLVVGRMARSPLIRVPSAVIIELFRGLPVVLLMFFGLLALGLPFFWGVVFGLAVYNSAVIAEILRAGIVSLPKGQSEAAYAIGLNRSQTLFRILLPQGVRRMLPALVSQFVVLLKDTSLGFIVTYVELLRQIQTNTQFFGQRYWFPFFVVGSAIYIGINFSLSRIAVWLERRGTKKAAGGVLAADQVEIQGTRAAGAEL